MAAGATKCSLLLLFLSILWGTCTGTMDDSTSMAAATATATFDTVMATSFSVKLVLNSASFMPAKYCFKLDRVSISGATASSVIHPITSCVSGGLSTVTIPFSSQEEDSIYTVPNAYFEDSQGTVTTFAGTATATTSIAAPKTVTPFSVTPTPTSLAVTWTALTNKQWNAAGTRKYVVSCPPAQSGTTTVPATGTTGLLHTGRLTATVSPLTHATTYTCTVTATTTYASGISYSSKATFSGTTTEEKPHMPILMTTKNIKFITLSIQVAIGKYNLKEVCYSHVLSGISGTAPSTTASPSPPSPCVMSSTGTGGNTVQNMTHHTVTIKYGYDSSSAAGTLEDDATYSFKDIYVKNTGTGTSDRLAGPITGATNPADPEKVSELSVNQNPTSLEVIWDALTNEDWNAAGTREYVVSCSPPVQSATTTVSATGITGLLSTGSLTATVLSLIHATTYTCTVTAR
eukprot:scpid80534/ scgid9619/ 